jgi:cell fate regulator YaaT (PSP1 superfamily)
MPTVVGLTFEDGGGMHLYKPGQTELSRGDLVVVDIAGDPHVARVVFGPKEMPHERVPVALPAVVRPASDEDRRRWESNRELESRAMAVVPEKIRQLDLPMKLIDVEAQFDGGRITVFFAAEGRIDFRELVRELVSALSVRVLMHQVGARDHAKMLGGIGSCGRELCCSTWMPSFEPVSMRMAKEQSLFLNPSKFSGNCGKLKCCLRYEYDFYMESHDEAPSIGNACETPEGWGRITEVNTVKGSFTVEVPHIGRVEMTMRLNAQPVGCSRAGADGEGCAVCAERETCTIGGGDLHAAHS